VFFKPRLDDNSVLLPFRIAHLAGMQLDPIQQHDMDKFPHAYEMLEAQAEHGPAHTYMIDGFPLACFGAVETFPGVAEVWLLLDSRAGAYAVTVGRNSRMYFDQLGPAMKLRRCQMTVDVTFKSAIRYAEWCRFEVEGVMRKYGMDGQDNLLMSRIYDEQGY
jgi:hypothetical protein